MRWDTKRMDTRGIEKPGKVVGGVEEVDETGKGDGRERLNEEA